jgi:enamine deaminase RidA (YjgF/YER057c/UK114 family)
VSVQVERKLAEMGLNLPVEAPDDYLAPAMRVGDLVFTSGRTSPQKGKVGADLTVEEGYGAARDATLRALAALKTAIGLEQITRVVRLTGYVNCADGFIQTPKVMNGGSDLLRELIGTDRGRHTRSAIGVYQLPGNAAVEVELVVEVAAE